MVFVVNGSDSTQFAWGISLGSLHWATHAVPLDRRQPPIEKRSTDKHVPAAVLLNRTAGEPIKLDYWSPPHPRGTASPWPPDAAVGRQTGSGRFPLAAAWTGRNIDKDKDHNNRVWPWNIEGNAHELSSLDAIANGASQLTKIHAKSSISAIVIPNDFRQREQQKLLDACSASGVNTSLLWLPVAAALAWLEQHQTLLGAPSSRSEGALTLPIVHADWGQIRCSIVELIPWKEKNGYRWIPARKRPIISDWFCPGYGWKEAAGCNALNLQTGWSRLFASPTRAIDTYPAGSQSNILEQVANWAVDQLTSRQIDLLVAEHLSTIQRPVSILFIGDFAAGIAKGENVNRQVNSQHLKLSASLIRDGVEGERLLARGAAIFARDCAERRTSYLDTLPDLELFVDRNHQYDWLSLLGKTDQYVPGGEPWELPQPIEGLALRRGATSVKLVVAHEEYSGVRELQVQLDRPAEQRLSAKLHVSAIPAQGNAKLRLITESRDSIPERSILANWDRMQRVLDHHGAPVSKEAFLKMQPRAFPELFPRKSSYARWRASLHTVKTIIRRVREESPASLMEDNWGISRLRDLLKAKDQSQSPIDATAIGSDFKAVFEQETLELLGNSMLLLWRHGRHRDSPALSTVVRVLGYISVEDQEFDSWLAKNLQNSLRDSQSVLHTAGLAMRSPENIAKLFDFVFFRHGGLGSPGANELKAVSQILRYRTDATREIESRKCEQVIATCLRIFEQGMERGGGGYPFRWSSLIIVYMLRRRMFDLDFLDPDKELAASAKELFRTAIERHKQRRLRPLGGSVDLPAALQQMIDYIDRKGAGDILMANE